MKFYRFHDYCIAACGGSLPPGAVETEEYFAPLVFAVDRPGLTCRGLFRISSLVELGEQESVYLLLPCEQTQADRLEQFVQSRGAAVVNTAFRRCWQILERFLHPTAHSLRVNLVGLGDVGGTVLTGLKLLGREIAQIGIYDPNEPMVRRYCMEMNQILPIQQDAPMAKVVPVTMEELYDCDALLFTASLGVPPVGSQVQDVRMAQYARNRAMLRKYARLARERDFTGLFCQISDPVDHLSRVVFLESNRNGAGEFDGGGLLPEQVQGYGLGVMQARAAFQAQALAIDYSHGAVFGPHGQDLVAANHVAEGYDEAASAALTRAVVTANQQVRALGFKPYIAPGLSSGAISVLRTLRGQWHLGAVPLGGAYFGCESRMTPLGPELRRRTLAPQLLRRLEQAHRALREFDYDE